MNLNHLRAFEMVARMKSFSRAALELDITQPAVSKSVRELEHELGMTLFDRTRGAIQLTEVGQTLFHYAQRIFAAEDAARIALEQFRHLERGRLSIGASATIGVYLLPHLLGRFHRDHPNIQLFLDIGTTREVIERLLSSPLDCAFVEGVVENTEIAATRWQEDTLVVIAAANHPLALAQANRRSGRAGVPTTEIRQRFLADVIAEPFIQREPGSGAREIIDDHLANRGITLRVAMEVSNAEGIKQMVGAGLGLAIISRHAISAELALGRLVTLDVPELTIRRTLWRVQAPERPTSQALNTFLTLLDTEPANGDRQ